MFRVAPVRRELIVAAGCERAFDFFTIAIDSWWPKHLAAGWPPVEAMHLEPMPDGRFWKTLANGDELHIGRVRVWQRPTRLVLSWELGPDRQRVPSERASEVELLFEDVEGSTRVVLEHRNFDGLAIDGRATRQAVGAGWATVLPTFAAALGGQRKAPATGDGNGNRNDFM